MTRKKTHGLNVPSDEECDEVLYVSIPGTGESLELTPDLLEKFKEVFAEVAKRARECEVGESYNGGMSNDSVIVDGCQYGVHISIEIAKLRQQFNS